MLHRLNKKEPHILTLIVMSSFAFMGAVIFTPALPQMARFFKISQGHSQLAITLFLIGYAIGQLIYGPLSNRFGRKNAFYIGIVIATIGSTVSIISEPMHSFGFLIAGRLLEALGSSAGLVIAFTIVNDHYYPDQARKIISYMMLAFAVVPGAATLLGGVLVSHFHWISCFYFLLIYGLTLSIPASRLAETAIKSDKHALEIKKIKANYGAAFKNKTLVANSLFFSLTSMCIYVYATAAPFVAINYLDISAEKFGFLGLIPFIGTGLGAVVSAKLSQKRSAQSLMKLGLIIELVSTILMAILFFLGIVNLFILIALGFIFMFGGCMIISNAASVASSKIDDKANASAVMNFINISMAVCGTFILTIIPGLAMTELATFFLVAVIVMLILWFMTIGRLAK